MLKTGFSFEQFLQFIFFTFLQSINHLTYIYNFLLQNVSRDEDPFVPTCQDLAGFWDMVSIQVEQIHKRFDGLVELKRADWVVKVSRNWNEEIRNFLLRIETVQLLTELDYETNLDSITKSNFTFPEDTKYD